MPEQKLKEEEKENKQLRGHRGEGNKIAATSLKYNIFSVRSVDSYIDKSGNFALRLLHRQGILL